MAPNPEPVQQPYGETMTHDKPSSTTPRTDAHYGRLPNDRQTRGFVQDYEHARQLERELAEAEWKALHRLEMFNQREQLIRDLQTAAMRSQPSAIDAMGAERYQFLRANYSRWIIEICCGTFTGQTIEEAEARLDASIERSKPDPEEPTEIQTTEKP